MLAIFADTDRVDVRAYTDPFRLFRRSELWTPCRKILGEHGPQDTRELSRRVAGVKSMDASNPVTRKALAYRIVQALTFHWKWGKLGLEGLRNGVRIWELLNLE